MKLTTKGRYSVMALAELAGSAQGRPLALADIARRQGISLSYLEQLFARLRRAGLVRSVRGPGGGYLLARPAADIHVADIVLAVERRQRADAGGQGPVESLWRRLDAHMLDFLSGVTLADLPVDELAAAA